MEEDGYLLQNDEWVPDTPDRQPESDLTRYRQDYPNNVVFPQKEGRDRSADEQLAQIEEDMAFEQGLSSLPSREQQSQRRLRSGEKQVTEAGKEAELAQTTSPLGLAA